MEDKLHAARQDSVQFTTEPQRILNMFKNHVRCYNIEELVRERKAAAIPGVFL